MSRRQRPVQAAAPRLFLGAAVALIGVVFTLDNLGLLDARTVLRHWPLLLVLFGGTKIVAGRSAGDRWFGSLWMLAGGWLLAEDHGLVEIDLFDLWPLVLVVVGGSLIFRAVRPRSVSVAPGADGGHDTEHAFALMAGVVRSNNSPRFRGGSLTAVMGGCELDLTRAELSLEEASIDTFAWWGGIEIRIPRSWAVESHVIPLMGGFEDKTTPPLPEETTGRLRITGWVIMGGVEVKN